MKEYVIKIILEAEEGRLSPILDTVIGALEDEQNMDFGADYELETEELE